MSTIDIGGRAASCGDVVEGIIADYARSPGGLGAWLRSTRVPVYARLCATYAPAPHWREIVLYLIEVAGGLAVDAIEERPVFARQFLRPRDLEPLLISTHADVRESAVLLVGVLLAGQAALPPRVRRP